MTYISKRIYGVPYSQQKTRGKVKAPHVWSDAVVEQTRNLPKVSKACLLKATFFLPENKFQKDFPYGSGLDNLLKRLLDALNKTVFSDAGRRDSCVVALYTMKTRVASEREAGVDIEVLPISVA